ncbi:spore maturation protein A, partial [Candidatus Gastranaerophilus sp. (ex Termes propinquus)]
IFLSVLIGVINGKLEDVVSAMLQASGRAVEVAFGLVGIMAFWLGIMKVAQKSGLVEAFSKLISPLVRLVFPEIPRESPAVSNISLNFTANALGLANAATPFGIKAMENLKEEGGGKSDVATNPMCTFLAMNTAGFQLVPTTVLAILVASGAKNPTEIIFPTLIVTSGAFVSAIFISKILQKFWSEK